MGLGLGTPTAPMPPRARSLEELLAAMGGLPGGPTTPPPPPTGPMDLPMGGRTEGLSPLGVLLAKRRGLQDAPLGSSVIQTPTGIDMTPPEQSPSRVKSAIGTALQAIAMTGGSGDPWQALGAGVTGAIAGGVSPELAQAFNRKLELDRNTGELGQQIGVERGVAGVEDLLAQAEYQRARPGIETARIDQQRQADQGRIDATNRSTAQRHIAASAADADRDVEREYRHKRGLEGLDVQREGIGQRRTAAEESANIRREANDIRREGNEIRRGETARKTDVKSRQATSLYQKAEQHWNDAQAKRAEITKLSASPSSRVANKDTIARLEREAEGLENKTRSLQVEGDKLAAEGGAEDSGPSGGTFDLRRWKADHPGVDPSEVIRKARDRQLKIIE